ncbi:MAG: tetratricopeptide repeat protein, partial [Candidatus Omnitrophica bacterium]|nr:tetratricopeptide repeat protein [Candidatus Omnitrophota bacterium]
MFKKPLVVISLLVFTFSLSACATTKKKVKRHSDQAAREAKEDIVVVDATSKKPEGTITRLTKAIKKNPRDVRAYSNRGDAYLAQGNYRYAISDYTRILQIDPLSSHTYFRRAF